MICPTCHGNGYWVENLLGKEKARRESFSAGLCVLRQVRQCETCNSQGEIKESSDAKINGN
jgi:DnaJ-class molecular chaperone